jgi:hypothetical protein
MLHSSLLRVDQGYTGPGHPGGRLTADGLDDFGVVKDCLWRALEDNLAAINGIQPIGDFRGIRQIRLGDQHRYPHRLDLLDHLGKALH